MQSMRRYPKNTNNGTISITVNDNLFTFQQYKGLRFDWQKFQFGLHMICC